MALQPSAMFAKKLSVINTLKNPIGSLVQGRCDQGRMTENCNTQLLLLPTSLLSAAILCPYISVFVRLKAGLMVIPPSESHHLPLLICLLLFSLPVNASHGPTP